MSFQFLSLHLEMIKYELPRDFPGLKNIPSFIYYSSRDSTPTNKDFYLQS